MKKLACLLLVLALAFSSVAALANSKSTKDMTNTTTRTTVTADSAPEVIQEAPVITTLTEGQMTETQKQLLAGELTKLAATTPASYFGADAMAQIARLLPGVDTSALQVNELAPIVASGDWNLTSGMTLNCKFPTQYRVGQNVVVLIGILVDGEIVWTALEGTVLEDGSIDVDLTASTVRAIGEGTAFMAVAND